MDREEFIKSLADQFPEVTAQINDYGRGLLHCEMADFRRVVEQAMDGGQNWRVEKYLRFIDACREVAGPNLANAIDISFLEDFALGAYTATRQQAVRERMPERLRQRLLRISNRWN